MSATLLAAVLLSGPGPEPETDTRVTPFGHMEQTALFGTEGQGPITVAGESGGRSLNSTVFGFLPYWVNYAWLQYDLVSVLACFSVDMGSTGQITNYHGFPANFSEPIDSVYAAGGIA